MTRRALVRLACLAGMAAIAGLEFHRVFGWGPIAARVVGSALAATAVPAVLNWRRGRSVTVTGTLSIALLAVYLLVAVVGVTNAHDIATGVIDGWSRILTTSIPAPPAGELLVLPIVITWVAVFVGVELALRTQRALLSIAPATFAYVLAMMFGIGTSGSRIMPAVAFVALAVVSVRLADAPGRSAELPPPVPGELERARQFGRSNSGVSVRVTVVIFLLVVVACAGLVGPHLPGAAGRTPYDPRTAQKPSREELTVVNPLASLAGWALRPKQRLFTVDASTPHRWRLAVLDEYDGSDWTIASTLQTSGPELPAAPSSASGSAPSAGTKPLVQQIHISGLDSAWLPAADRPTRIDGVEALFDASTGTIAIARGTHDGLDYTVVSGLRKAPDCTLASVPPASTTAASSIGTTTETRRWLDDIGNLARQLTASATSPCERARRIEQFLRTKFAFDVGAHSGSHLRIIHDFLFAKNGQRGTSEQFAGAFALLGRAVGLPTRVVVGFHAGTKGSGHTWTVQSGDAFAWPEVAFTGIGWVAFQPMPTPDGQAPPPEDRNKANAETDTPAPRHTNTSNSDRGRVVEGGAIPKKHDDRSLLSTLLPFLAAFAAIMLVLAALTVLSNLGRRRRRRKRRAASDPRLQVLGAWHEGLDALAYRGLDWSQARTATQWVEASRTTLNGETEAHLAPLAAITNAAAFAPLPPNDELVESAWEHAEAIARAAQAGMSRRERLAMNLDPRPIWSGPR